MIKPDELVALSRLALSGKESDLRLYLAKLIRKLRKSEPELGSQLEELLKTQPARSNGVLRRGKASSEGTELFEASGDSSLPLLKSFEGISFNEKPMLEDNLKLLLQQVITERGSLELLQQNGLSPASSLIFQGPPGVGKTMTAQWLASELRLPFYVLDLTAVMSSYLGKTGSNLRSVIEFAKSHPCVLLLDEIDAIAKRRSDEADVGELKRLVTVMLQELENWPSAGVLIAATNHPELVDPALWRRFDIEITFQNPSNDNVHEAVDHFLDRDLKYFKPWKELIVMSLLGSSYSHIKRAVLKLRKQRVLQPSEFDEDPLRYVLPNIDNMQRSERIDAAVQAVTNHGLSQQKASKIFSVSRDTIRKRIN
jgi:SpoVK/Ycf46/Vps4 family AAA+-type ATPase